MNTETMWIAGGITGVIRVGYVRARWRHEVQIDEGRCGLLFRKGRFVETLDTGLPVKWGRRVSVLIIDLRRQSLSVAGQEVLTKDNVGLKSSALVNWQIVDPVKGLEVQLVDQELYQLVHQALRQAIGEIAIEDVLAERMNMGVKMLAAVAERAEELGVKVHSIDVRDVMIPADLRKALNEVLKAKQVGLAALERTRGESAARRNLATAARLMNDNPALMNLRVLQTVNDAKEVGNNTLVMGIRGGFVPMKQ
jgi:regulator of protease activity HflC (stomatin/prohibitin superfamily)